MASGKGFTMVNVSKAVLVTTVVLVIIGFCSDMRGADAVSYTHLTLPTSDLV